jgi:hypothetical protein
VEHRRETAIETKELGLHTCNPSTQEAQAGELQVEGHPGLPSKTPSQKNKRRKREIAGSIARL